MVALTAHGSDISKYIYNQLFDNRLQLGLEDVWDGDQTLLPHTPAACIESGPTIRTLVGAPSRTDNAITAYIMVYHSTIQDQQRTTREALQLAEGIEDFLHQDLQFGGLVVHGFITAVEPGFSDRSRSWYRSVRLTWEGTTRTQLHP